MHSRTTFWARSIRAMYFDLIVLHTSGGVNIYPDDGKDSDTLRNDNGNCKYYVRITEISQNRSSAAGSHYQYKPIVGCGHFEMVPEQVKDAFCIQHFPDQQWNIHLQKWLKCKCKEKGGLTALVVTTQPGRRCGFATRLSLRQGATK